MKLKNVLNSLNPFYSCKKYSIPFWQCPSFVFLLMGGFIIVVILLTYFIATAEIGNPKIVNLIILGIAAFLIMIDYIITKSFERISEAYQMKTEFINIVSHQLRTPLVNLKYSLSSLMHNTTAKFSPEQLEYLNIFKENNQRMIDLLKNLLTLVKIETKELSLKKEEVSLTEITKKVILNLKSQLENSNIVITLKTQKNLPKILGDLYWIEQIIKNLLDNAIRYSLQGGEIKVRVYFKDKKVHLEIQDTGVGIPIEEQKYIFQKFFRSENILKYQTKGTGLSLYISKKILNLMKGRVWFRSKENKGTTFYIVLPPIFYKKSKIILF